MANFAVHGISPEGKKLRFVREAASEKELTDILRVQGYTILSLKETSNTQTNIKSTLSDVRMEFGKKSHPQELTVMTRQMATLLGAGINLANALQILVDSSEKKNPLRESFTALMRGVQEGKRPEKVMEQYPHIFSAHYRGLVTLGINTGNLKQAFESLSDDLEKELSIRKKMVSSLTYPVFTFIISLLLNLGLFIGVLPKIVEMISDLDTDIPTLTQWLMFTMDYLTNPWFVSISIIVIIFTSIQIRQYISTPIGRYYFDYLKVRFPVIGPLNTCMFEEKFCRSMSLLLKYAVPLQEALTITNKICANSYMEQRLFFPAIEAVEMGESLTEALEQTAVLQSSVIQMVATGESTGDLSSCLNEASKMFEMELNSSLQSLVTMLEPAMIVFMSVFVLFIILAVMLPLYQVIQNFGA